MSDRDAVSATRPDRSRGIGRRVAAGVVAVAAVAATLALVTRNRTEDPTPAGAAARTVGAAEVRRWSNPAYEPDDPRSHAYRLPPLRAPWPSGAAAATVDPSTELPPVPGVVCGTDVRKVPRAAAMVSITSADGRRSATVTGWWQGLGRRRFAQFVAGEGPCLWYARPQPVARARWTGDEGWLAVLSDDDAAAAGGDQHVQAFAIERLGDVTVAVRFAGEPGQGARQAADQAAGWAEALARQLRSSRHPALSGAMPVTGDDVPVRLVTPRPDRQPSAGNPIPDRVEPPAAALPPALVLVGTQVQRPAREHTRTTCGDGERPDPRTAVRTWVYERGGTSVASGAIAVEVGRWPVGAGAARFAPRRGWADPCDLPAPSSAALPAPGWADATHVLQRRLGPSWQARVRVGDDVVAVTVFPQDWRLDATQAGDLARSVADAFAARLG